ncbi:MAG: hypothetical protein R3E09_00290 [Novosphingobium sp.]
MADNLEGNEAIHLLTDTPEDCRQLQQAFANIDRIEVHYSDQLWADSNNPMRRYPGIVRLRAGHPCWRKLTDPMLLARDGDEVAVIDPDVYFLRRFSFETVGDGSLRLMWQRANCLLPYAVVEAAFAKGLALADHVDIGVAQYRAPLDLEWLDWAVNTLGDLPTSVMHVEAVLWSCLAMHMGGGYLEPIRWHCWTNTQWKRIRQKLGATPTQMLASENFGHNIAFHAGGPAKHWLAAPGAEEILRRSASVSLGKAPPRKPVQPFVPFTIEKFEWLKKRSYYLDSIGYYKLMGSRPPSAIGI